MRAHVTSRDSEEHLATPTLTATESPSLFSRRRFSAASQQTAEVMASSNSDTVSLRIASPAALPSQVASALEFAVAGDATIAAVKREVAERLNDALLFGTGEPWTRTVYNADIEHISGELLAIARAADVEPATATSSANAAIRLIFQGRFLQDESTVHEVVHGEDAATFHMVLKATIVDELVLPLTSLYHTPSGFGIPETGRADLDYTGISSTATFGVPFPLFSPSYGGTAPPQTTLHPPPIGTNIVIYQDPLARTPLLSPGNAMAVVTQSGRLALLLSPQGIAGFAAAGVLIHEGVSDAIQGVEYSHPELNEFFRAGGHAAPDGGQDIFNALLQSRAGDHPVQGGLGAPMNQQQRYQVRRPPFLMFLEYMRELIWDFPHHMQRIRTIVPLLWLFVRLVLFVSMFAGGDLGSTRFWSVMGVAVAMFLWRLNAVVGIYLAARAGAPAERRPNFVGMLNNNAHQMPLIASLRDRIITLRNVILRPYEEEEINRLITTAGTLEDTNTQPPPPRQREPRYVLIFHEIQRIVVVFIGTLIPAVYDAWHRHELVIQEAQERMQRVREAQAAEQ
ncbi:uncharacterized protein V1518DRAFT_387324, partial [Limtongia smithiae]|uniref:uncharacterized protein n=1 Tax=Limtongia smithiae TaxID=1125753 RepID=UPI0034CD42A8